MIKAILENTSLYSLFERFGEYCDARMGYLPLNFVLGFFCNIIIRRWLKLFTSLGNIDKYGSTENPSLNSIVPALPYLCPHMYEEKTTEPDKFGETLSGSLPDSHLTSSFPCQILCSLPMPCFSRHSRRRPSQISDPRGHCSGRNHVAS